MNDLGFHESCGTYTIDSFLFATFNNMEKQRLASSDRFSTRRMRNAKGKFILINIYGTLTQPFFC